MSTTFDTMTQSEHDRVAQTMAIEAARADTPKLTTHFRLITERKKMRQQHPDGRDTLRLRTIRKELKRRLGKRDTERAAIADVLGIREPSQEASA